MRQKTLTQSGAPGRVIGWTNFSHWHSIYWFCRFFTFLWICLPIILLILVGVWASFVCSCHSILECCVKFSGVKLSIRSFVLFRKGMSCSIWHLLHWLTMPSNVFCMTTVGTIIAAFSELLSQKGAEWWLAVVGEVHLKSGIGESLAYANGVAMAWPLAYLWHIHGVPMAHLLYLYNSFVLSGIDFIFGMVLV